MNTRNIDEFSKHFSISRNNVWNHNLHYDEGHETDDDSLVGGKNYLNVVHGDDRISFDSSRKG